MADNFDDVFADPSFGSDAAGQDFDAVFSNADWKPKRSSLARRAIGDTAVSLGKGIIGAGEAAVGLADLATGGAAGKALEGVGYRPKQTKEFLDEFYSPEQKAANQRVQEAEGFFGTAGAMLENPSTIAHTAVESVPNMLGGGAIARGLGGATKLGAVARGAIGEGAVGAGSAAEQVRQQTDDGLLTAEQTAASLASGIGTGLLGAAGGRVAQRLGIGDVDTALAGGALQTSAKGRARRFAEGAVSEGVLEELPQSMLEQSMQNAALGRPLGEGVPEAAATGLLTGAAMGGGVATIPGRARPERERPSPADDWVGALERAHGGEPDSAARYNRLREQDKDLRDFLQYSEPWLSDEGERSDRDEQIQREVDVFQSPQTSPEQRLEAMQNIYGTLDDEISDFVASREAPDPEVLERELAAAGVSPPAPAPVIDERRMAAALDLGIDPAAGPLSKAATEALGQQTTRQGTTAPTQAEAPAAQPLTAAANAAAGQQDAPVENPPVSAAEPVESPAITGSAGGGLQQDQPAAAQPRILSTTPHRGIAMARVAQARRQNPSANVDMVKQGDGWAVVERPAAESPQLPGATNGAIPADPTNAAMAAPSGAQGGADLARGAGAAVSQPDVSALGGVEPVAAGAVAGQQPVVSAGNASGGRAAVGANIGVASGGARAGNAASTYALEPSGIRAQVGADSEASLANPESSGMPDAPRSATASAQRGGITASRLSQVFAERFPKLAPAFRMMVERGMRREKGGVVMVNDATPQGMAQTFARSTGRRVDEVVQYFRSEETGDIQGFYDPRSGLTFLVAPNLNDQTAPAVLLHEMIHSQQREKLDVRAMAMLNGRASAAPKERAFLDRVARRMADAGETGNPREATSYIVEQAVLEGRDAGYTAADGKLADWIEANIGKPVANLVRGFMMMVRGWIVRSGLPANTPVTVDDLVSYAMAGMERAARGDVRTSRGRQEQSPATKDFSGDSATLPSNARSDGGSGPIVGAQSERGNSERRRADASGAGESFNQSVSGDPLAHAEMPRQASTFEEARAAAKAFQGQPLTNRASGMAVTVSRNNLDKMLSQSAVGKSTSAFDQSLAVANLDHLFNNAVFGWTKPDRDSDPNIVGVHRFFAPMDTANGTRVVKLTVKESARQDQGSKIYTVESLEIESPASIWVDSTVQADGLDPTSTPYAGLIQSLVEAVQQRNARRDGRPQFSRAATAAPPLGDQVRAAANRITGRRPTDPSDPFATENARLREQDKTLWDKAKKLLRRQLAPGGLLPESVFAEKIARDSEFQAVEFDVRHIVGGLERAVRADYGVTFDKLTDEQQRELSTALAGKMPTGLPEATKTAILAMRQYIDKLSTDYLHIVQGKIDALMEKAQASGRDGDKAQAINEIELYEKIKGNIGQYVHRSYQAFDDPKWFQKVPTGAVNAARQYLKLGYMEDGKTSEAEALRLAEVTLHEILKNGTAYDSMESFIAESKLGAKDLSVLMRRKEVPIQIRALLGEYTDPRLNFAKSATKMGRLIWNQRFLERVREVGAGAFLFDGKDRPPEATAHLAADGSEVMAPLNGLWTYPEVAQAFKDALGKEQMSGLYRAVVRANGFVKYGKTVLSPTTAMRNWQSAMFFALANGHFDLTQMKKSVAAFREQVRQNATGDDLAYLRHLKQLGVVYDTPAAGEMMRLLDDAKVEDLLSGRSGKAVDFVRKANQMAQGFYSFGDDFWKIIGFENEKANLQKAGMPLAEAEREAAKRIRDMYPTYSMVGRGVQWLSRFPLAGTFVSFPAEIVRTTGNMLRTTAADLKSDNPGMRQIGIKRAVGMALVSGMFWALSAATKAMFDVDDDEEEALRDLAPEWQKNSTFLYAGRDDKGNLRYFDMSFLDPYGYWKRPVTAMLRNQPWEKSAASALSDMVTPFLGADITADAIFQALANQKPTGGRVYQENDTPVDQAVDIANHLRKSLQPGFMGNIERFALAAQDVKREGSGQPYSLQDEMVALLGWRASTMDPKTALYYRSFEFTDAMSEARQALTRTLRSVNEVSSEDIAESRERARRKQVEAFTEMHRLVQAARQAGMTHAEIIQTLRLSNISQGNVSALMRGVPPPLVVGAAATRNAVQQARGMQGPEFASEVARRFREAAAG
ncbi:hypothetical protein GPA19_05465 [Azoarcus indigens]|uniref:Large polyvalent protein-associated domain-containing protein n=1 Tax=Azoarcus indigens TaxID=29545 RepID=A0A4V3BM51_9RHOO|nr:hypothetical protein [Azoarcus indigens]NMG64394.1 hypothetical protein [Azoarcus indigens]TDN49152.1 hypothetical protein C7389_1123 [Azoarcus indigens]